MQLGRREQASPASPKLKIVSCFGRKNTDYVYQWVKFSIQNAVLRVSRRKNSKMFPCGTSFSFFLRRNNCRSALVPQLPGPLPLKISGCTPALRHYYLCKTLHLKRLTVFGICLCLGNFSVNCTVTLCYVFHQTHLK